MSPMRKLDWLALGRGSAAPNPAMTRSVISEISTN